MTEDNRIRIISKFITAHGFSVFTVDDAKQADRMVRVLTKMHPALRVNKRDENYPREGDLTLHVRLNAN